MADDEVKRVLHIDEFFGDGVHRFTLHPLKYLRELQDKFDTGPMVIFNHIRTGEFRVDEVRETVRLGLIGGGKTPAQAERLIATYFDASPAAEHAELALAILVVALFGGTPESAEVEEVAA